MKFLAEWFFLIIGCALSIVTLSIFPSDLHQATVAFLCFVLSLRYGGGFKPYRKLVR